MEATKLFNDAQALLRRIIQEKLFTAKGVVGLFPANSVGDDDIEVYHDESRQEARMTLHVCGSRTKTAGAAESRAGGFHRAEKSGLKDYSAVSPSADGVEELARNSSVRHDDYNAIMAKALADRLAEAFAECLHKRVRNESGDMRRESSTTKTDRARNTRHSSGARLSGLPGSHRKALLCKLIEARKARASNSRKASPCGRRRSGGLYFAHPESQYFAVGNLGKDQVEDYARRKDMSLATVTRWLSPNLGYEPEE